jgi:hypothetical protein
MEIFVTKARAGERLARMVNPEMVKRTYPAAMRLSTRADRIG